MKKISCINTVGQKAPTVHNQIKGELIMKYIKLMTMACIVCYSSSNSLIF